MFEVFRNLKNEKKKGGGKLDTLPFSKNLKSMNSWTLSIPTYHIWPQFSTCTANRAISSTWLSNFKLPSVLHY